MIKIFKKILLFSIFFLFFSPAFAQIIDYSLPSVFVKEILVDSSNERGIEGRVVFISEDERPFYDFNYVITLYKGDYRDETFGPHPIILGRINGTDFNIFPGQEIEFNFEYKDNIIAEGKNTLLVTIYNKNNNFISQSFEAFEYNKPVSPYFKIGSRGANLSYLGEGNNLLLAGIVISENDADTLILSFEVDEFSEIHEARVKINTYRNNVPNLVSSFVSSESHMIGDGISSISQQIKDPEISRPGSYLTNIYLINNDGVRISNIIEARYFLEGSTAEILRLISDKNSYNSGDTATVTVDFVGSFAEIIQLEEYTNERILEVSLFDNDKLIETQQREIIVLGSAMRTEEFQFKINQDIGNVILKASITRNGELLVNYSAGELIEENIAPARDINFLKIILISLLILIGIIVFFLIKKGKLKIKKTAIIILAIIILTSFSLINASDVSASSSCTGCFDHSRCNTYDGRCGNISSQNCFGNWFPRSETQGTQTVAWCLNTSPACCTSCCQQTAVSHSFSSPLESTIYEVGRSIPVEASISLPACSNSALRGTVTFTLSGRSTSITNPLSVAGSAVTFSGNIIAPSTPGIYTISCSYTLTGTWTRSSGASRTATRTGSCGSKTIQVGMRYHFCDLGTSSCLTTSELYTSKADCEAALAIHRPGQTLGVCWSNLTNCEASCTTTLSVSRDGTGSGTITSNPSGINCGTTCSASYLRTANVTLTANPDSSSFFVGWDLCPGTQSHNQCRNISMTQNRSATAEFGAIRKLTINSLNATSVSIGITTDRNNNGTGSTNFERFYNNNTSVTAIAPATHTAGGTTYRFTGWSGCTSTSGTTCNVTMNSDKTITAGYIAQRVLSVNSSGIASVSITGVTTDRNNRGNGSTNFSRTYDHNTTVNLTAPATHTAGGIMYLFTGWSGCTSTSGTSCNVTMDSNKTITATYIASHLLTIQINSGNRGRISLTGSGGNIWDGSGFISLSATCTNITTNPSSPISCTYRITNGSSITLTADRDLIPFDINDNYYFHQWTGDTCSGLNNVCTFTMNSPRTATANFRQRPRITNLGATPYIGEANLCNKDTAPVRLSWRYNNNPFDDEIAEETQITISINDGITWTPIALTSVNCTRVNNGIYDCSGAVNLENFNSNHNWRIRSKNQNDAWSHTRTGTPFHTPLRHPNVNFAWLPTRPHVGEETTFLDRTNFHAFSNNRTYTWTFVDSNPLTSILQNPNRVAFQSDGAKNINLRVTGTSSIGTTVSCNRTLTVNIRPALPQWEEEDPFGFIKDIFAINFNRRMNQLGLVF